ncbi:MAG: tRNA (uridine(54)-C5)-methyltransferase TrmA [Spongiibacteraceae bacterium]|jgi:tRNA (uracil-5-)-methyltransferase|nr:tRNA (uridine(54)-C5)-methyltransferase TrmA [Spongiibacteraceae bacterium]
MALPIVDPALYESQLATKVERFLSEAEALELPAPAIFRSPPLHYRLRAEFRIWHDGERLDYAMFAPEQPKVPVLIDSFPAGSQLINHLMPALRQRLQRDPLLRRKLFQVEFLTTLSGEALVTLVYHRRLDESWLEAAGPLRRELGIELIGRSRGQKIVLERDWLTEELEVNGRTYSYQQIENSFTQPNGAINQSMLSWAQEVLGERDDDLLELYCGNGNFTMPLARGFRRVLATEISKTSIASAQLNARRNRVNNVELVRMSSEEISAALNGVRPFRRLAHLDLASYAFRTLLVDPPRAGLDAGTLELAKNFERILYISCNPKTLLENLTALKQTHQARTVALFDQFPYTEHLECGVLLERC